MKVTTTFQFLAMRATGSLVGGGAPAPAGGCPDQTSLSCCPCGEPAGGSASALLRGIESWAGEDMVQNLMGLLRSLLSGLAGPGGCRPCFGGPRGSGGSCQDAGPSWAQASPGQLPSLCPPWPGPPGPGVSGPAAGQAAPPTGPGTGGGYGSAPTGAALPGFATFSGSPDDAGLETDIDEFLAGRGSPAAGQGAGAMMVEAGREHDVDPLVLLAIAGHETGFGTLGVGMDKMLGVGAFDDNPNGQTQFNGLATQIGVGAKTFANLRQQGGAGPEDSIEAQLGAAGQKWATDPNWAQGVMRHYQAILEALA